MTNANTFGNTENNLATKDANFRSLEDKWNMVDSLKGGTDEMRAAGQLYLPKATNERDVDYANRLAHSTLFNYYKQSLDNSVYHLTQDPIAIDNTSPEMDDFFNNVDLEGRDINQFTTDVLKNSIHHGISYIMVDYTATDINSKHDQSEALRGEDRPYWVEILATQVMSFRSERYQGSEVLSYFRFLETVGDDSSDPTGHTTFESKSGQQFADQIREYFLDLSSPLTPTVKWRTWRRKEEKSIVKVSTDWYISGEGVMEGVERIPIVPVYSNRISFYLGEPTFNNLAELNIRHWQTYSDQANLLHYARFPILFATGIDDTDENGVPKEIEIGANTVQYTDNPSASLEFVEHSGKAVDSGWQDIDRLEEQMKQFGVDPVLTNGSGNVTATEVAVGSSRIQNMLRSISTKYEVALTQVLALTALYYGSESIPIPTMNTELFRKQEMTQDGINNKATENDNRE